MRRLLAAAAAVVLAGVLGTSVLVVVVLGGDDQAQAVAAPATQGVSAPVCSSAGTAPTWPSAVAGFAGEQLTNAAVIVAEGRALGVPQRGWVIAVATAMQEATLRVLTHGDRMPGGRMSSSRGLFQQLEAWGPMAERLDPARSAAMFFTGGRAGQPGLLHIPGWQKLSFTGAAQAVQRSETPNAYAKWEQPATQVVAAVSGLTCTGEAGRPAGTEVPTPDDSRVRTVIDRALSQLGVPYAWGGGDPNGPTLGIRDGGVADAHGDYAKVGFDCSGLVLYAYAGIGVAVPHQTQAIWAAFTHITDRAALRPGDLLLYSTNGGAAGIHHVGIYLGGDAMVEAPQSGELVRIGHGIWDGLRGAEFIGAVRPA